MVGRQATLSRVLQTSCELATAIDGLHGARTERAVTHRRRVDDGFRPERLLTFAGSAKDFRHRDSVVRVIARLSGMRRIQRKDGMLDDEIVGRQLVFVVGTEAKVVVLPLRRRIDPAALVAAERAFFVVARDDVLPQLRPDRLKEVSKMSNDRKVSEDRMATLCQIMNDHSGHHDRQYNPQPHRNPQRAGSLESLDREFVNSESSL